MLSPLQLFKAARIAPGGRVVWSERIPEIGSGVYVVSIANPRAVRFAKGFEDQRERWKPDQGIIYIGRGKCLAKRLSAFYRQKYDAPSGHRGGRAVLLIKQPKAVHWAAVTNYGDAERRLLEAFYRVAGRWPFGNRMRSAKLG
jgi:hypothetical protein